MQVQGINNYGSGDYFDPINLFSRISPEKIMEAIEGRRVVDRLIAKGLITPKKPTTELNPYDFDDNEYIDLFGDGEYEDGYKDYEWPCRAVKDSVLELLETQLINGDARKKSRKNRGRGALKTSRKAFARVQKRLEFTKNVTKSMTRAEVRLMLEEKRKSNLKSSERRQEIDRKEAGRVQMCHNLVKRGPDKTTAELEEEKLDQEYADMKRFERKWNKIMINREEEEYRMRDEAQGYPYETQFIDEMKAEEYEEARIAKILAEVRKEIGHVSAYEMAEDVELKYAKEDQGRRRNVA